MDEKWYGRLLERELESTDSRVLVDSGVVRVLFVGEQVVIVDMEERAEHMFEQIDLTVTVAVLLATCIMCVALLTIGCISFC